MGIDIDHRAEPRPVTRRARRRAPPPCLAVTLFALSLGTAPAALAGILVPTGIAPGDSYRLAFVTSGARDSGSSNIGDYNAFVQAHGDAYVIANGGAAGDVEWFVIGSTLAVDARDNTSTNPSVDPVGAPVYNLNGELVAATNSQLWGTASGSVIPGISDGSGQSLSAPILYDESGSAFATAVHTGTTTLGTTRASFPLGGFAFFGSVAVGDSTRTDTGWIDAERIFETFPGPPRPFYALSEILTLPFAISEVPAGADGSDGASAPPPSAAPVPAPATLGLLLPGILALAVGRRRRRPPRRRHHDRLGERADDGVDHALAGVRARRDRRREAAVR